MEQHSKLIMAMTEYYRQDPARIQHFLKVYEFSRLIGTLEEVSDTLLYTLETAAIVHDIGIKISEEKYNDCSGKHQEEEGPAAAEPMLKSLGYPDGVIERVCYLIAHHHTYHDVDGMDYQILIEADFLVNLYEDNASPQACRRAYERIFRTTAGKRICRQLYPVRD